METSIILCIGTFVSAGIYRNTAGFAQINWAVNRAVGFTAKALGNGAHGFLKSAILSGMAVSLTRLGYFLVRTWMEEKGRCAKRREENC